MTCQLAVGETVAPPGEVLGEMPGDAPGDAVVAAGGGLGVIVTVGDGEGLGVGVVPVGVQPAKSTAAKMTARESAMNFFITILLLTK